MRQCDKGMMLPLRRPEASRSTAEKERREVRNVRRNDLRAVRVFGQESAKPSKAPADKQKVRG